MSSPAKRRAVTNIKPVTPAQRSADYSNLDLAVPSTPANSFITDICIWFVRERGNWLATTTWVTLLKLLEIPEPSARTALHRMTKAGYLEREARDGRPGYAMSQAWIDWMPRADLDFSDDDNLDDGWALAMFSIPEKRRAERHLMRTLLGRLGFASLGNGVWIASAKRAPRVRDALEASGLSEYVDLFHAEYDGFVEPSAFARRCWDLDALASLYEEFIRDVRRRLRQPAAADASALRAVVHTSNEWRRIRFTDPELPTIALPGDWPQQRARKVRDELLDRFAEPALQYVNSL